MMTAPVLAPIPHLDQYFGIWSIRDDAFRRALERVETIELLTAHVQAQGQGRTVNADQPGEFEKKDGIATINLIGAMTKFGSSLSDLPFGTVGVRKAVRDAARAIDVDGIVLRIDSPGGTLSGTPDLADDVADAAKKKPVVAFIEDLGASAAYWVASQATRIVANTGAVVGSIGTYLVVDDFSERFEKEGVKTRVLKAGEFKGAGVRGTQVSKEQLDEFQRVVNELNEVFLNAVAIGRGMSIDAVRELADGRVHVGAKAKEIGLVDSIGNFKGAMRAVRKLTKPTVKGAIQMSETKTTDKPAVAGYAEIKTACPGADNDFICEQLEAGATVEQSQQAWMREQASRTKAAEERAAKAEAEAVQAKQDSEAKSKKPGVDPVPEGEQSKGDSDADPIAEWNEAVSANMKKGMDRGRATREVVHSNPELHRLYLEAFNSARGRKVELV